ncbi:MAG: YbaY family lipoprotein [Anaerolineae bacterium]|nr:YbaY family lipoprotein [Anaerolineae bacterium]
MRKSALFLFVMGLTAVLLTACGGNPTPTPAPTNTPAPEIVVVPTATSTPLSASVPTPEPTPTPAPPAGKEVTWFVGPTLVECMGVAPQTCLQVKQNLNDAYTLFYDTIQGFAFEEGYEYEIIVRIEPVANPPADASAYVYTLLELVSQTPAPVAEVTGTVTYLARVALPDDVILRVQIQDTSRADAPAIILGEEVRATGGAQVPLPFAVPYNPADIQDNRDYTLSARITDGQGTLLFINDMVIPVISKGNPTSGIEVMVVPVGGGAETSMSGGLPPELLGQPWQWASFSDPAVGPVEIADPENYRLQFAADGTVLIQADCNSGSGIYSADGASISIIVGPMTRAFCGEDSLDTRFLTNLGAVVIWFTQEDDLYFDLKFDSGTMRFVADTTAGSGEAIAAAAPESESSDTIPADMIQIDLQGLADSYTWEARASTVAGSGGGTPAHIIVTFDEETADEALANNGRYLAIFPVEAYKNIGGQPVVSQITRLEELIATANGRTALPADPMPLLPPPLSFMNRWSQFADLSFQDGTGVRYVSEAPNRQGIGPWVNLGTAYYYEGLTSDGRFYISLHWPVSTAALPDTPADVPADIEAQSTDPDTYNAYLQATKDELNALAPADWQPDLAKLDALVNSVTFKR